MVLMRGIPIIRRLFFLLAALPAIYLVLVVQYGAITMPFGDDFAFVEPLASWYDGSFQLHCLWAPYNQARPLVYRVIFGLNAILTNWDIRSEYIYIYLAFYGTFACQAWGLYQITKTGRQNGLIFPMALVLASLLVFSPVGNNDQWWSFMFLLDGGNLFIAVSFVAVFLHPRSAVAHIGAAIACWLASYTITNGVFAMVTICLVFYLTSEHFPSPSRWALFWGANVALLLVCYIPGLRLSGEATPSALQLFEFCTAYLGAPLGGLLWFPYRNMFDLPQSIMPNALFGAALLVSSAFLCWDARFRLREQRSVDLILLGFTIFAITSAIITGWGRASNGQDYVSNENASRYTIFGAYLLLGQLHYLAYGLAHRYKDSASLRRLAAFGAVFFIVLATVSYDRAIKVFRNVHEFNQQISSAYIWGLQTTPYENSIYPNPPFMKVKSDLQRLELGPYNDRQYESDPLPIAKLQQLVLLSSTSHISQTFTATKDGLKDVEVMIFKPNGRRTLGIIHWQVTAADESQILASGVLNAGGIEDYDTIRLKLPYLGDSEGRAYCITLSGSANSRHALAVALYAAAPGSKPQVSINGSGRETEIQNLSMALVLDYAE